MCFFLLDLDWSCCSADRLRRELMNDTPYKTLNLAHNSESLCENKLLISVITIMPVKRLYMLLNEKRRLLGGETFAETWRSTQCCLGHVCCIAVYAADEKRAVLRREQSQSLNALQAVALRFTLRSLTALAKFSNTSTVVSQSIHASVILTPFFNPAGPSAGTF
jgi:hypothetical protein